MARIRQIKPEFFLDDDLALVPPNARLLFIGLWVIADREGRLEDRPAKIKAQVFPYDADISYHLVDSMLSKLEVSRHVIRYQTEGRKLIQIRTFTKHQHPHLKEVPSIYPAPTQTGCPEKTGLAPTLHQPCPVEYGVLSMENGVMGNGSPQPPKGALCEIGKTCNGQFENCSKAFDRFWAAYPRHDPSRKEAKKSWCKQYREGLEIESLLAWIEQAKQNWDDPKFIPMPTTWINQRRWEGDLPPVSNGQQQPPKDPKPEEPKFIFEWQYDADGNKTGMTKTPIEP